MQMAEARLDLKQARYRLRILSQWLLAGVRTTILGTFQPQFDSA